MVGVLATMVYTALVQRGAVVAALPQSATLFRAIGLHVNPIQAEIRSVRARIEQAGAEQNLVVEGDIVNVKGAANTVPDIKLSVIDDRGNVIYSWIAPLQGKSMKAGEKLSFRANLASPPAANRKIAVAFAG